MVDVRGELRGVDAVVDKDRSAAKLALLTKSDLLLILTAVDVVQKDFGTPNATPLRHLTAAEARDLASEFPEGSMGPKVDAACDFVENGGPRAVITSLDNAAAAVAGEAGTEITA